MKCALFLFKLVTAKQHLALNTGLLFWYTLFPCVWSVLINARLSHLSPPPPQSGVPQHKQGLCGGRPTLQAKDDLHTAQSDQLWARCCSPGNY